MLMGQSKLAANEDYLHYVHLLLLFVTVSQYI